MKYLNVQNVKALARQCNEGNPVGRDFIQQIDDLIECIKTHQPERA